MKIEISEELFTRLQKLAVPFVDTPETVIEKAISMLEGTSITDKNVSNNQARQKHSIKTYKSYEALPSVKHTKPKSVVIDGVEFTDSKWSGVNHWVHTRAAAIVGIDELISLSKANIKRGIKEENGFDYLPKIGCSIQRSDASTTLRQICHLAKELDFNVSIFFEWKDHEEAAYPAESACLELIPLSKGIDK